MSRVYMGSQGWGVVTDFAGNVAANATVTIKNRSDGTNATHYSARTGGSSSTAAITTDSSGRIDRWIDPGEYTMTSTGVTKDIDAVSGSVESRFDSRPVNAMDYLTGGATDEAALLAAALVACAQGRALYVPRRSTEWTTSVPIPITASIEVYGDWTVIRQTTWRNPVFDLQTTDDVDVHHFYLRSTATRTSGAGSFRGDDEDRYGAGVWFAGNRCKVRHIRAEGLDSAVHATNWTTGSTHSGRRTENIIEDIRVSGTDFGVLAVAQEGAHIENIRGSVVRSTGSGDPCHLVYVTQYGSDKSRDLTGGNWRCYDSGAANNDPAYQLRHIEGGALGALIARNCGGILNYEDLSDFTIDRVISTTDQRADEVGSIVALTGTSERLTISKAVVVKAVSGRAVLLNGTDCEIADLFVKANRSADDSNGDVVLDGTRCKLVRPKLRNAGSSTTGSDGIVVRGTATGLPAADCEIIDPDIRNDSTTPGNRNGILINSGALRTVVRYDTAMIVPKAGSVKVSDSGTSSRVQAGEPGDIWHEIGAGGEPAFTGTWVNFGTGNSTAAFRKDADGYVHLKGVIKTGTIATAAFTLPAGYRPALYSRFATVSNGAFGAVEISNAGVVLPAIGNNTYVSLDGISFRAV